MECSTFFMVHQGRTESWPVILTCWEFPIRPATNSPLAITMNKGYTKAIVDDIPELHIAKSLQIICEYS